MSLVTAKHIQTLLAARHVRDIYVPECCNGPSWGAENNRRLDGWAMRRSWSNPMTWAYEIKVSRSDFLQDNKWPEYLQCCNEFYFVAPKGVIARDEVPQDAGLIEVFSTGTGMRQVKKAPHRPGEPDAAFLKYILQSRCKIVADTEEQTREERIERWEQLIARGKEVDVRVKRMISQRHSEIEKQNGRLQSKIEALQTVERLLEEWGVDVPEERWEGHAAAQEVRQLAERHVSQEIAELINRSRKKLDEIEAMAERIFKEGQAA